jgi:hypothetical protein
MLPTKFDSLGKGVSEEKIFSEISQSEPRMICGGHVCYRVRKKKGINLKNKKKKLYTRMLHTALPNESKLGMKHPCIVL